VRRINDFIRILRQYLRHGELVSENGVVDATVLCDTIKMFALESAERCLEGSSHFDRRVQEWKWRARRLNTNGGYRLSYVRLQVQACCQLQTTLSLLRVSVNMFEGLEAGT
jgi:hypothetical protein